MTGEVVAIVPARGGSKGIPRKNLQVLGGRPLLAWTIDSALQTTSISRVYVSSDCPEIRRVAAAQGAIPVERPAEISGDEASSESALLHGLDRARDDLGHDPELVVFLQATSPLRPPHAIQEAIDVLRREQADSLLSATAVQGFVWRVEGHAPPRSFTYDHRRRQRRQDAPQDWIENGSIYVFKPWVLRDLGNRLGGKVALYPMHPLDSFQIDEPGDLEVLGALMERRSVQPPSGLGAVQLLVLDFDGVLTDGRVLVTEEGHEAVHCSRRDGFGLERLRACGVEVVVLSKEQNRVVAARCAKLKVECLQACEDKLGALKELAAKRGLGPEQIAYVGDDLNDLACLTWAGHSIAVHDAEPRVLRAARASTTRPGGRGAVREVCEWILAAKGATV